MAKYHTRKGEGMLGHLCESNFCSEKEQEERFKMYLSKFQNIFFKIVGKNFENKKWQNRKGTE